MQWKIFRQEEGVWRETGEVFTGSEAELEGYLEERRAEDGWDYRADAA